MDIHMLREQINEVDQELVRAFEKRMHIALEIAKYKKENGLPVYDPVREEAVLKKQMAAVDAELAGYTQSLYQTLFEVSRRYQQEYLAQEMPERQA
jgi:monofunctional chorismate mutase